MTATIIKPAINSEYNHTDYYNKLDSIQSLNVSKPHKLSHYWQCTSNPSVITKKTITKFTFTEV